MFSRIQRNWICVDPDTSRSKCTKRDTIFFFKWISRSLLAGIFFACSANFAFSATIPPLNLIVSKDLIFLTPLQGRDRLVIIDPSQKKAAAIPVPAVKKWSGTMAVSDDGDQLYLVGNTGMIYEINPNQRKMINSFDPLTMLEKFETDMDISGYLRKSGLDWKKFPISTIFKFPNKPRSNIHSIALGPKGNTLFLAMGIKAEGPLLHFNYIPLLMVIDLPSQTIKNALLWGEKATSVRVSSGKENLYFDKKADRIFLSYNTEKLYIFNRNNGSFQFFHLDKAKDIKTIKVSESPMLSVGGVDDLSAPIHQRNKIYFPIQTRSPKRKTGITIVNMSNNKTEKFYIDTPSIGSHGAISPDGKHLFLLFEDLWDIDLQRRVLVHQQSLGGIYAVSAAMSPDGRELFLLGPDSYLQVRDVRTYKVLSQIGLP